MSQLENQYENQEEEILDQDQIEFNQKEQNSNQSKLMKKEEEENQENYSHEDNNNSFEHQINEGIEINSESNQAQMQQSIIENQIKEVNESKTNIMEIENENDLNIDNQKSNRKQEPQNKIEEEQANALVVEKSSFDPEEQKIDQSKESNLSEKNKVENKNKTKILEQNQVDFVSEENNLNQNNLFDENNSSQDKYELRDVSQLQISQNEAKQNSFSKVNTKINDPQIESNQNFQLQSLELQHQQFKEKLQQDQHQEQQNTNPNQQSIQNELNNQIIDKQLKQSEKQKNVFSQKQRNSSSTNQQSTLQNDEEGYKANSNHQINLLSSQQLKYEQTLLEMDQLIDKYQELLSKASNQIEQQTISQTLNKLKSEKETLEKKLKSQRSTKVEFSNLLKQNLNEIYQFYARQNFNKSKNLTFERLQHEVNIMNLGKFMYFCRDFKLINLTITLQLCQDLVNSCGYTCEVISAKKKEVNKKSMSYAQKQDFLVNKFLLVELFKKSSGNSVEIKLEEFEQLLNKMASMIFQSKLEQLTIKKQDIICEISPVTLLFNYLGVFRQQEYRKKMQFVGQAFDMKDRIEKISLDQYKQKLKPLKQEYIAAKQILRQEQEEINIIRRNEILKISSSGSQQQKSEKQNGEQPIGKVAITWDHLAKMPAEKMVDQFDPRQLLMEQDLEDEEDNIYLNEYHLKNEKDVNEKHLTNEIESTQPIKGTQEIQNQPSAPPSNKQMIQSKQLPNNNQNLKLNTSNQLSNNKKIQQKNNQKGNRAKSQEKKLPDANIIQQDVIQSKQQDFIIEVDKLDKYKMYGIIPKPKGSRLNQSFSSQRYPENSPNKYSKDIQQKVQQITNNQAQKEQDIYAKVISNQNQRVQKMINKQQ